MSFRNCQLEDGENEHPRTADMNFWNCKLEDGENEHHCGQMKVGYALVQRCTVLKDALKRIEGQVLPYSPWHKNPVNFPAPDSKNTGSTLARPGKLYLKGALIDGGDENMPYIAISYVWAPSAERKWLLKWNGRCVTDQALKIAERISEHTSLAIWIDAICINQHSVSDHYKCTNQHCYPDTDKKEEMAKMDDIYRGAAMVVCIMPDVREKTCKTVAKCNALMNDECYANLNDVDIYGSYMFATLGQDCSIETLFKCSWWTRVWTFQEAVLNERTFLVGDKEESIPIQDVFRIAAPVQRRAASVSPSCTMKQKPCFWDSVAKLVQAPMLLGDAMPCVWRRDCSKKEDYAYGMLGVVQLTKLVTTDYVDDKTRVDDETSVDRYLKRVILKQLFEAANSKGDYSWTFWCHEIDHDVAEEELCMVPTIDQVSKAPFMSITKWKSSDVEGREKLVEKPGADEGVLLPYSSTGLVIWESAPQSLPEMVKLLEKDFKSSEIWDMLFGMRVGLCVDINRTVHKKSVESEGIALPLLNLTLSMVAGSSSTSQEVLDLAGSRPQTETLGFTNFAAMAAVTWEKKERRLIALRSQFGTMVISELKVEKKFEKKSRIYLLPIEYAGVKPEKLITPRVAFVAHADTPYTACAVGCLIPKEGSGLGRWQLRRFGTKRKEIASEDK